LKFGVSSLYSSVIAPPGIEKAPRPGLAMALGRR
jgi:hypothetical protein